MSMLVLFLLISVAITEADYACVCNYGSEVSVQSSPGTQSSVIGHLFEFDCKEFIPQSKLDHSWLAVAYKHMIGYVPRGGNVQIDACAGNPPIADMTTRPSTTMSTSSVPSAATSTLTTPSTETSTSVTTSTTVSVVTTAPSTTILITTVPSTTISTTAALSTTASTTTTPSTAASKTTASSTAASTTTPSTTTTVSSTISTTMPSTTSPNPDGNTKLCTNTQPMNGADADHVIGEHAGYCYELISRQKVSWQHAEQLCTESHAHLASITSPEEQAFVQAFLMRHSPKKAVWIGLHDSRAENYFEWTSGDRVTYTNWVPGHTGNFASHYVEDCVALIPYQGGKWDDIQCGNTGFFGTDTGNVHYALCKYKAHSAGTVYATTPVSNHNLQGNSYLCRTHAMDSSVVMTQYGDNCYELLPDRKVSWQHGEHICQMGRGHLAYIGSAEEQRLLQAFLQRHSPEHAVWIGLNDRNRENHFEWTNGKPITYTNWVPGHTGNFRDHYHENCVAIIPYHEGKWDDIPCGNPGLTGDTGEVHPILCQYKSTTQVFVG